MAHQPERGRRPGGNTMLRVAVVVAVLGAMLTAVMPAAATPDAGPTSGYIVVLKDSVASATATATAQTARFGVQPGHVYEHVFKGYSAELTADAIGLLRNDPAVAAVYPDGKVQATVQTLPTGINRVDGELSSTVSGNGAGVVNVDIAIIDTGSGPHPDLNVVGGTNCVTPGGSFNDDNGHGTHVAGTAAARDNADFVVGVAPGARIWSVKVLNAGGSGSFASIVCGIDWVTARSSTIEVANMSLGGAGVNDGCNGSALHLAICRSTSPTTAPPFGVTYAVAAGNSAANANNFVPATYSQVITVSALADFNGLPGGGAPASCLSDTDDTFAFFSNFGGDIDLIAPGVCILSTGIGGGVATLSGTSMASPHVAGAAALYKAVVNPSATPPTVRAALIAAGNLNWSDADDPDPTKERLLNVNAF